ncbi:hypothetical protein SEA_MACGULLY_99 [Rhodococcus phage MacGully]|nr:hypothetical protein SEA_MACGULLY_99 [Rhodococcus phage MacGully]
MANRPSPLVIDYTTGATLGKFPVAGSLAVICGVPHIAAVIDGAEVKHGMRLVSLQGEHFADYVGEPVNRTTGPFHMPGRRHFAACERFDHYSGSTQATREGSTLSGHTVSVWVPVTDDSARALAERRAGDDREAFARGMAHGRGDHSLCSAALCDGARAGEPIDDIDA